MQKITKIIHFLIVFSLIIAFCSGLFADGKNIFNLFNSPNLILPAQAETQDSNDDNDYELYQKYLKYKKYDKRQKYRKYKKYKNQYGFADSQERILYKTRYDLYKQYLKDKTKYRQYAKYESYYKRYKNYKNKYQPYAKYSKYQKYNKAEYGRAVYAKYGTSKYINGYKRYLNRDETGTADSGGPGPEITVGLWNYSASGLDETPFRVTANKNYNIKDSSGNVIGQVAGSAETKVSSANSSTLKIYNSISDTNVSKEVIFDAVDGDNASLIFDANRPGSSFDHYRGKMALRISDDKSEIWAINTLPLEHYIWGMGEITGEGPAEYNRTMTTAYRTYGYWKIKYSTKYAKQGFKVTATASSQVYYGYDWETTHTNIRSAAEATRGTIVMYKGEIAITPYSSWTDGRTRSWKERWGSENYPWCKSVSDTWGKHPTMSTKELENDGNHMVGMSAHGALYLARDHGWDWQKILKYYYDGIDLSSVY